ncbi:hypothetical protein GARC_4222 [Paraglaciecola arctica BSs20135]|uniref:Uncharacterized protein n=1 Tax=Paraglaciecola arctica BSs20135 TaxID=493475 RepID=K6XKH1_9ALTE|nr:hypothetical protein GARC_4222 [Paraglaciecola arctica BSs20135]
MIFDDQTKAYICRDFWISQKIDTYFLLLKQKVSRTEGDQCEKVMDATKHNPSF